MALRKAPAEDLDMDQLAEAELSRLQRQYRIMEGARQSYSQEANIVLQRQRRMIRLLEAEKKELLTDIRVAKSPVNTVKDRKIEYELIQLLNLTDKYDAEIKSEKLQLSELRLQIKKVEKEVFELKKFDISDSMLLQKSLKTQRNVHNLENRLGVVTSKFNMMIAENENIREEINHLLKDRAYFNKLYQQLVSRLNSGNKMMMDLIEQATQAYDQREEAQNKLQALKERGKQNLLQQKQEMRELQRRLDYDDKLQTFLGVKGQQRIMTDLEAREAFKCKKKREATEYMIAKFEEILSQIKEFSGEDDIDRLAAQFVKQEEENFTVFNYVTELNSEVELLQEQVCELHKKTEDQRELNNRRALQQQETLALLDNTLCEKRSSADSVERKLGEYNTILDKLLYGIDHIFHIMQCDKAPILSLLGDNAHVTAYNVMLYLDIIERRINDLMNMVHCLGKNVPKMQTDIREDNLGNPCPLPID